MPTTGAARIPGLQTGKADLVISTLSITPERAKVIDFSKGYAVLRTVIATPKNIALKSMADLDGKTVGTVRGTTHDTQLTKEGPKGMKLVRYEDDATEAQAFLSGQVDIFSTAELLVGADRQEESGPPGRGQVRARHLQARHRRQEGRDAAPEEVDKWIATNLKNGKLDAIYKKYHGNGLPDVILNQ